MWKGFMAMMVIGFSAEASAACPASLFDRIIPGTDNLGWVSFGSDFKLSNVDSTYAVVEGPTTTVNTSTIWRYSTANHSLVNSQTFDGNSGESIAQLSNSGSNQWIVGFNWAGDYFRRLSSTLGFNGSAAETFPTYYMATVDDVAGMPSSGNFVAVGTAVSGGGSYANQVLLAQYDSTGAMVTGWPKVIGTDTEVGYASVSTAVDPTLGELIAVAWSSAANGVWDIPTYVKFVVYRANGTVYAATRTVPDINGIYADLYPDIAIVDGKIVITFQRDIYNQCAQAMYQTWRLSGASYIAPTVLNGTDSSPCGFRPKVDAGVWNSNPYFAIAWAPSETNSSDYGWWKAFRGVSAPVLTTGPNFVSIVPVYRDNPINVEMATDCTGSPRVGLSFYSTTSGLRGQHVTFQVANP
jgi:hypothetical protein